jgi:hypothetical protein
MGFGVARRQAYGDYFDMHPTSKPPVTCVQEWLEFGIMHACCQLFLMDRDRFLIFFVWHVERFTLRACLTQTGSSMALIHTHRDPAPCSPEALPNMHVSSQSSSVSLNKCNKHLIGKNTLLFTENLLSSSSSEVLILCHSSSFAMAHIEWAKKKANIRLLPQLQTCAFLIYEKLTEHDRSKHAAPNIRHFISSHGRMLVICAALTTLPRGILEPVMPRIANSKFGQSMCPNMTGTLHVPCSRVKPLALEPDLHVSLGCAVPPKYH